MNITIPVSAIKAARKLLTRIHFERLKLPVLTHVLATIDAAGLTLAVSDLDHWLETRLPATNCKCHGLDPEMYLTKVRTLADHGQPVAYLEHTSLALRPPCDT
jgi:hypothetical protein